MNIVCGTDFSVAAARAADIAHGIARRLGQPLTLVHVLEMPTLGGIAGETVVLPPPGSRTRAHADVPLEKEATRLSTGGVEVTPLLAIGETAAELLAISEDATLLVCGSHGRGAAGRMIFGSVADRLVRDAHVPLLVVRGDSVPLAAWAAGEGGLPILVGIDDGDTLPAIARLTRTLDAAGDCFFHYAHVVEVPALDLHPTAEVGGALVVPSDARSDAAARLSARIREAALPPAPDAPHICVGRPATELIELTYALAPGLLVTGTHGRGGGGRILGSIAQAVLHRAPCPVAIAPPAPKELT